MRHFYIFNIKDVFLKLIRREPDILFNTLNSIYNMNIKDINYGLYIYNNIIDPINKNYVSENIYKKYLNDTRYLKFMNTHMYNNYFNKETTRLIINNSFFKLDSTSINPTFFKTLNEYKNLFVCDFENKDYFWLESIA